MICPQCRSERCHRSRRQGVKDHALSLVRLRPWRCRVCKRRFYAWLTALSFQLHVHCRRCGNLDVQRISSKHVERWHSGMIRLMGIPAYRCDPCRHRFFSMLSFRRVRSIESEMSPAAEPMSPAAEPRVTSS